MRLRRRRRPAALRPRLYLHLHPLRRLRHGHQLPGAPHPEARHADLPAHAPRPLRRRGHRRVRRAGHVALHQVGRGPHRREVGLGPLLRGHKALQRADQAGDGEVGDELHSLSPAHRPLLRALPQVELRDGRRPGAGRHEDLLQGAQAHVQELRRKAQPLSPPDEVPRGRLELPGPLLRELLQLAGQRLGHRRPRRDGEPELHQAA